MNKNSYRLPVVAGMFYPGDMKTLSNDIEQYFKNVPIENFQGQILGLVAPHAGYIYSGFTASYVYKQLTGKEYKTVVVISPSHREHFYGISVFPGLGFTTPLGKMDIDMELKEELLKHGEPFIESDQGHGKEHALEVQLPFLQYVLKEFKILPLVMGDQNINLCKLLGENLASIFKDRNDVLIVASSDLSHYHNSKVAEKLDSVVINDINNFNWEGLLKHLSTRECEACGGGPISAMLIATEKMGATKAKVVHYSDSGDMTNDKNEVVGYLSAIIWKSN
jgi:MEMO1 family protein